MARMKVGFFHLEGDLDLVPGLRAIDSLPDSGDRRRTHDLDDIPFRITQIAQQNGRYWRGDICRIRMNDVPQIVSVEGETDDVDLEEDEGMGEQTAFLYDPETRVLAIQLNRTGVAPGKWGRYIEHFLPRGSGVGDTENVVVLEAIERRDQLGAVNRLTRVSKATVRIARATNLDFIERMSGSTAEAVRSISDDNPEIEVTIRTGRRRRDDPIFSRLASIARSLFSEATNARSSDRIIRLDVTGKLDDDEPISGNLLAILLRDEVEVDVDNNRRRPSFGNRIRGIQECWERNQAELESRFRDGTV